MKAISSSFPKPVSLSPGCSRWKLSALLRYECEVSGNLQPNRSPEKETYLTDRQVAERYSCSRVTVWRWARNSGEVAA